MVRKRGDIHSIYHSPPKFHFRENAVHQVNSFFRFGSLVRSYALNIKRYLIHILPTMVSQRRRYALAASCLAAAVALGNAFTNNGELEGMRRSLGE